MLQLGAFALLVAGLLAYGLTGGGYEIQLGTDIAMFIALALSWNVISGFTGYVSFGQVVFFGLGALTGAELINHANLSWYTAAPVAGIFAGLVAIPVGLIMLRLRGIYFALGMFGLVSVSSLLFSQWSFTGGATGLTISGELAATPIFIAMAAVAVVAFALNAFITRSTFGLRAMSIRDDEEVAEAMGVPTVRIKVMAFALSAILPAVAGSLVAYNRGFIDVPGVFESTLDVQVILFVLGGGIGTLWGPVMGAVVFSLLGDRLRSAFPELQLAMFGALIVAVALFLPGGLVSLFERGGLLRRVIVKAPKAIPEEEELEARLAESRPARVASATTNPGGAAPEVVGVHDIGVTFGGVQALSGVTMDFRAGETVFIIGANGAGKTTLFNVITGLVKPSSGSITFEGHPTTRLSTHHLAEHGVGRTFQIPRPFESMTVWENLLVAAAGGRMRRHAVDQAAWVVRVLQIDDIWLSPVSTLPVGHRRMVELGRALALQPRIILLDEVMAGMSDEELERVRATIRRMPSLGVDAVAGIEHVIKAITDLADRIVVMDAGKNIMEGPPAEVLRHPEVVRAYMGTEVFE
jgi:branched-chain amino acid transport system permease protein